MLQNGSVDTTKNTGNIAKQTLTFAGLAHPIVQAYKYDPLYRLTEAKETANGSQNWIQNFGYDRYGNRTSFSQNIAGITTSPNPTVDANTNRFNTGQGFTYDKNGNIIADIDPATNQARTFVFNGDNKQTQVKDANGSTIGQYFYDGEGKRVKKVITATGETTVFVYSAGKLVAEYSTEVAPLEAARVSYTTTDHLGSPRVITDQYGQVISRRDFRPFGEELSVNVGARSTNLDYGSTEDNVRQKYTGYQKDDETSLDFAEARMYENRFGRFTAVDPLLASGNSANPQSFNRYVYVSNSPLVGRDPSGRIPEWVKDKNKPEQPVWISHEEFLKGGYEEFDSSYTSAGGNSIVLDPNGPFRIPGTNDRYAGWSLNGVSQGTGIYAPSESGGVQALAGGFEQAFQDIRSGSWTGVWNVPSTAWNVAITSTTVSFALPFSSTYTDGFGLPGLKVPIPFLAKGYEYQNERQARWGQQVTAGLLAAPGVAAAPFRALGSLSVVPEVSTVSSRSAASTAFANTGSYIHRFESGKFYVGKGPISRMKQTGRFFSQTDPLVSSEFFPATSNRAAFMNEHRLMMSNGGPLTFDPLSPTYNKIFSPGRRFF